MHNIHTYHPHVYIHYTSHFPIFHDLKTIMTPSLYSLFPSVFVHVSYAVNIAITFKWKRKKRGVWKEKLVDTSLTLLLKKISHQEKDILVLLPMKEMVAMYHQTLFKPLKKIEPVEEKAWPGVSSLNDSRMNKS